MTNRTNDVDILIVGAGPVGLFLANECARRGLRFRIIEARAAQSVHSKALAIFPRTLEIFDMAGLVAPFLQAANPVTSVAVISHQRRLAHMAFAPEESPYRFIAMVPQDVTEKLLVAELVSRGVEVEYNTSFVSAKQQNSGVLVTLERGGDRAELRASFVVGCDGAHSAVRHELGLTFEGAEYESSFLLADVETNTALPGDELVLCPSEHGPLAIFPMSATRRRIVAMIQHAEGDAPSLQLVQTILDQRGPRGVQACSLHWSSHFRIHHRSVSQLRAGRIFLAGDAAHIHSPFGGQGMNTGLHDVWNLAWKLDLFLRGQGSEQLLDSYSAERIPVIRSVIDTTDTLTKVMGTPNKLTQLLRDAVIPMVSRLAPFQHAFVQRLSELDIAYPSSPIVEGPGGRYFDDSMRGGRDVGRRFVLLADRKLATGGAARQLAEDFGGLVELRESRGAGGVTLVRPDGYTAFRDPNAGNTAALGTVRSLLAHQIRSVSSLVKGT